MAETLHGGYAVSRALKALGVENLFTLSGGHIFPIFDGCHNDGIRIVDVRHEQTAGYAAEGWARLTRTLGVAAVTAGPGVTNIMSPLAQAGFNQAPVLTLAGRAPMFRWGQGSLQEIDHIPFIAPLAAAETIEDTTKIATGVIEAGIRAMTAPRGPRFLDLPLDVLFNAVEFDVPEVTSIGMLGGDLGDIEALAGIVETAERPVIIAGSNVWLDGAEESLQSVAERASIPVYMNGQGRGCVPAGHRLAMSRSRSAAVKDADLVIIAGAPMDFRLGFGQGFASGCKVVHLDSHPSLIAGHVELALGIGASLDWIFTSLLEALGAVDQHDEWLERLGGVEETKRQGVEAELASDSSPIHPMRVYGELGKILDKDAVVIGDGGDFVSYAGREIRSHQGGRWLDPGPFGCLGAGPGYAIAARLAYPDAQVCLLYGDGAIGFAGMELEAIVRHDLPIVAVVGNNGIWGLEKHPMKNMYGYDVAADLQPGLRYDQIMEAFGGKGETVTDPAEVGTALRRAFDSGAPYLVNVITDPEIAYPRSANLA